MSEDMIRALTGGPVPAVHPDDLRRVWAAITSEPATGTPAGATTGISINLVKQLCENGSVALAAWVRMSFLDLLQRQNLLDAFRDDDGLQNTVFETAARFPLPHGLQHADVEGFMAALL